MYKTNRRGKLLNKVSFTKLVIEGLPLSIILIGVAFVSFSLGPYQTYDTQMEFEAASNVLRMGIPFVKVFGTVIDQPPLGFYTEAAFFRIFGLSTNTGVTLVTLFGLGSVALLYVIGKRFYGKSTGLLAAALFGLNPWQVVLSRSFLIDSQCLFLSLLCLYIGILAINKVSVKLTLVAGLVFAAAVLTKFFAVFVLIPLLLFYIYSRPKRTKQVLSQLAAFFIPALVFSLFWYQVFLGRSLFSIFDNNNVTSVIPASTHVVPSPFFVTNFLLNYGVGLYFLVAAAFSLVLVLSLKRYFSKVVIVDLICLATIAFILSVNFVMGAVFKLNVPYFSAIKYDFQALPFLVLLVGSLITKSLATFRAAKSTVHLKKHMLYLVAASAVILFAASLISSMFYTNALSTRDYLQYRVEPQVNYGYALSTTTPLTASSSLITFQYLGFAVVLSGLLLGLLWTCRHKLQRLFKRENVQKT
jgi:4-amino-4-deoxy-L-arabinose transferase-like glycosyltransferase